MTSRWVGLRALAASAKSSRHFLIGIAVAFGLASAVPDAGAENRVVYFGLWLQLAGIWFVVSGLTGRERLFGLNPFHARAAQWLRQLVRVVVRGDLGHRTATLSAEVGGFAITGGRASLIHRAGPDSTVERRIEILEKAVEHLRTEHEERATEVERNLRRVGSRIDTEQATRASEHAALASRLERLAVGDTGREAVGVAWLVIATVCTSIPSDLVWFWTVLSSPIP